MNERTESGDRCESTWQGPSDEQCADDLLVIRCAMKQSERLHGQRHGGYHPDTGEAVFWWSCAGDLESLGGDVIQAQFLHAKSGDVEARP